MKNWDKTAISNHCLEQAKMIGVYIKVLNGRRRDEDENFSESEYDRNLAEFSVYDRLHGRTFSKTREKFVSYLKEELLPYPPSDSRAFNQDVFTDHWRRTIKSLIAEHESE